MINFPMKIKNNWCNKQTKEKTKDTTPINNQNRRFTKPNSGRQLLTCKQIAIKRQLLGLFGRGFHKERLDIFEKKTER